VLLTGCYSDDGMKKNEMIGAYGTYVEGDRCIQGHMERMWKVTGAYRGIWNVCGM
jgi:hypothetical protein